jgi:hypothetical protein
MPITTVIPAMLKADFENVPHVDAIVSTGIDYYINVISYTGRVIALREENKESDSDFIATVWGFNGQPIEITYASTRYHSKTNSAVVDATPEVLQAYHKHDRHQRAIFLVYRRALERSIRAKANLSYKEFNRLKAAYVQGSDEWNAILTLLNTRRFRSDFRKSLARTVREWCVNPEPIFIKPLSYNQLQSIL